MLPYLKHFIMQFFKGKKIETSDDNDANLSDGGGYDELEYEDSSKLRLNQEQAETTVCQNPYYERTEKEQSYNDMDDSPRDTNETENVKVVQNEYYE